VTLSYNFMGLSSPNIDEFFQIYISQGSAATQLSCGDVFSNHYYEFSTEYAGE